MEKEPLIIGLIVKSHDTKRKADKDPIFRVGMKSKNGKIILNMELPDLGRQIFQLYPLREVVELTLREPSQVTLDAFRKDDESTEEEE